MRLATIMLVHHTSYSENEGSRRSIRTIGKSHLVENISVHVSCVCCYVYISKRRFLSRTNIYYMLIAISEERAAYISTTRCMLTLTSRSKRYTSLVQPLVLLPPKYTALCLSNLTKACALTGGGRRASEPSGASQVTAGVEERRFLLPRMNGLINLSKCG